MWAVAAAAAMTGIVSSPNFATRVACSRAPAVRAEIEIDNVIWPLLHHVEGLIGVAAAVAIGMNLSRSHRAGEDGELRSGKKASIKEAILTSRASSALTYGDAHAGKPAVLGTDASEEIAHESQRRERRRLALGRAQSMLDAARDDVQDLLEEAVRMDDRETAVECARLLEKMRPLPEGIALTSRDPPDYKRWLDPDALR